MWPPDYHSVIIKTTDGGDTWEGQYGGSGPTEDDIIRDLSAVSTDTAWAVQGNRALRTTGSGWAQFSIPGIPGGAIVSSISAADADTAWVSGYGGNIIKTTDGGQSWLTQYSDTSQSIGTLTAIDSNTVWACGGCTTGQLMLKTTDGNTWMTQSLPSVGALRDMCAVDVNTAWTVSYDTRILHTTDGGSGQPMPYVASVTPSHGQPWAEVTVSGSGFRESRPPLSNVNFGPVAALEYTSWSDTEISCRVPSTLEPGEVPLSVTTLFWTSNEVPFTVEPATVKVTSITPASGGENTVVDVTDLLGAGFQEGATVRIEKGSSVISATEVTVVSDTTITCRFDLAGAAPGRYAVIVTNPDASEGRLQEAFLVSGICGGGAGVSLGAFCCLMGVLSLAGSGALLTGLRKMVK